MKNILQTTILLLGFIIFAEGVKAQTTPKKPQSPMAKINAQRDRMQQKVAAQQNQLKYVPTNASSVPPVQNRVSGSPAALPNKQAVVKPKEK